MPAFLAPYALRLALFGAAVMAVMAAILGIYEKGKHAQRIDDLQKAINDIATANNVAAQTSGMSDVAVRDELRKQRDSYKG